jgi:hypothetical protein
MIYKSIRRDEGMLPIPLARGIYSWPEPTVEHDNCWVDLIDNATKLFVQVYMIFKCPWRYPKLYVLCQSSDTSTLEGR